MFLRIRGRLARYAALAGLVAVASCTESISDDPRFEAKDCRRVGLVDLDSGEVVIGAEDIAVDFAQRRLFVSAYNRRAAEKAARKSAFSIPQGGLYSISVDALRSSGDRLLPVRPLVDRGEIAGGLRPHGIDFDATTNEISFINRSYQMIDRKWRMTPRLERIGADGERFVGANKASPCAANDVLVVGSGAMITFDHASCGVGRAVETLFGVKKSGIADQEGHELFNGALFANGLASDATGRIALAATRERSIHYFEQVSEGLKPYKKIAVAGGPDNLSVTEGGDVVAAVHPSMIRLALHRKLGLGAAPSRVIEISADGTSVSTLFDDASGELFSGATVGVMIDKMLVAGSATDSGLLVCQHSDDRAPSSAVIATFPADKARQ